MEQRWPLLDSDGTFQSAIAHLQQELEQDLAWLLEHLLHTPVERIVREVEYRGI